MEDAGALETEGWEGRTRSKSLLEQTGGFLRRLQHEVGAEFQTTGRGKSLVFSATWHGPVASLLLNT